MWSKRGTPAAGADGPPGALGGIEPGWLGAADDAPGDAAEDGTGAAERLALHPDTAIPAPSSTATNQARTIPPP
jgi:hypothetical protein